jgi:sulfotransferase family protein
VTLQIASFRDLRKRFYRSVGSWRWERRLRREIDEALRERSNDLVLPDFLIIGAPKCATSWLQAALNQHPQVRMVPDEIEYFSSHVDRPLQWYLDHFKELIKQEGSEASAAGQRLVLGEKSAGYCGISPARIKLVQRLLPHARLILMIRDPVKRHWSHAKRYFSKEKSQEKGYRSLDSRQRLFEFFKRTRRFSEFSKIIESWTNVYAPERLLVINQEEAFANPVGIFERALRHIGVAPDARMKMKRVARNTKNRGPVVPMPEDIKAYLETMFAEERHSLAEVLKKYSGPEPAESGAAQAAPSVETAR